MATQQAVLVTSLHQRYKRTHQRSDLDALVDGARRGVDVAVNTPMLPYALDGLGAALFEKFEFTGSSSDLNDAIRVARMAVEACPKSDQQFRPGIISNLALKLKERARKTNDMTDIEEGIRLCKEALRIYSSVKEIRLSILINLSALLGLLYRRQQNVEDLEEAIKVNREAVELAKDGSEQKAIGHNNLGNRLENLYTRTGNPEWLNEAIQNSREALRCTSDEMLRASRLSGLAKRLTYRYERTMNLSDLDEALGFSERAVALDLSKNSSHWPSFADRFAIALHHRYKRTGEGDVETCIRIQHEAINHKTLDRNHPDTRGFLNNLGSLYMTSYRNTGDVASLQASRDAFSEAITMGDDAGDADHPLQLERLSNLGVVHYNLYYQTRPETTELLEEALQFSRRAVNSSKDDYPKKAEFQTNQGIICECLGYLDEAYEAFAQSAESPYALPSIRLQSARIALRIAAGKGKWDEAISLAKNASKLLPLVCSRYISLQDQEYTIKDVSGLAADSCSLLLMSERPEEALQQLEFGRGLILGYLVDGKSDLSLMKEDPEARELVERYERLRDDVSRPVDPQMSGGRDQTIEEIERCVDDIRKLPNYSSFLSEPAIEDILGAAEHRPVIIVNCTDFASHAIIIWQGKITSLLVDQLSMKSAPVAVKESLKRYGHCTRGPLDRTIGRDTGIRRESEFLSWLWNSCVKAVLEELKSLGFSLDGQQRVWWIGTGVASSFPFHAAGIHSSRPSDCTMAQVISSYVPTIKTLLFSRSQSSEESHLEGRDRVLFVGMPTTPGDSRPLPGVLKEEVVVRKACAEKYPFEARMHPTADQVVEGIAESKVLHLACHGWSDPKNPSESHLLLQKQDDTGAIVDKLTVARLSNVRETDNAFLVFLSACSTAEVKATSKLADEALHLASIFQISGFPHAIGSLWSASDPICVQVAGEFYRSLFGDEHGGLSDDGVAKALHSAIQKVRFRSRDPEVWAPFVHFGA